MIDATTLPSDALVVLVALLGGYLAGSAPSAELIGRSAGVDVVRDGGRSPGPEGVWRLAGPGWGLLALTGDLAKGVLPVAIGIVTWSWSAGWLAGLGALTGACWPMFGRRTGGRGVAVFAGAVIALDPPAGMLAGLCALAVLTGARLLGRNGRMAALATGAIVYPFLFMAAEADVRRLAAVLVLYGIAAVRYVTTRR